MKTRLPQAMQRKRWVHEKSGRTGYAITAIALLVVSVLGAVSFYQQSNVTTSEHATTRAIPLLNLNYLNASQAKEYGILGLLNVSSSSSGSSFDGSPGQTLQFPLTLSLTQFDSSMQSVIVSFKPTSGQEVVGAVDVSAQLSYSNSSVIVYSGRPVTVTMYFHVPINAVSSDFKLVPAGLLLTPPSGIALLIDTNFEGSLTA